MPIFRYHKFTGSGGEYNWHILEPHSLDFLVYDRLSSK